MPLLRRPCPAWLVALLLAFPAAAFAEKPRPASEAVPPPRLGSSLYRFEDLRVQPSAVGERRDVARQPTATLEEFECHHGMLQPGRTSHAPHQHPQEELIILTSGALEVFINGVTQRIGPGSLFFFASYDWHNVTSVGEVPARYAVFNFATAATRHVPRQPAAESAAPEKLRSKVYDWTRLSAQPTANGLRRAVFDGPTVTCSRLECHVTTLAPGRAPHPAHRHPDEEVIFVKEGTLEVSISGRTERAGPGSVVFFASGDEHGLRNVGDTPATYYVMRVATESTPHPSSL